MNKRFIASEFGPKDHKSVLMDFNPLPRTGREKKAACRVSPCQCGGKVTIKAINKNGVKPPQSKGLHPKCDSRGNRRHVSGGGNVSQMSKTMVMRIEMVERN
jgi:hypothetical protein